MGTCTDTDIIIPETYNSKPVKAIGEYAFYGCLSLGEVIIGSGVTSIVKSAFAWCESLSSIKYRGAQSGCNSIYKGDLRDGGTGKYTITYNYKGMQLKRPVP